MKALPKVIIDARMVGPVGHGIARYVTLLARGLRGLSLNYEPVFLVDPVIYQAQNLEGFPTIAVKARFLSFPREWAAVRKAVQGATLFHSPSFASFPGLPVPYVVTVHDLNHLTYGSLLQKAYYRWVLKPFMRRARAVATVSEFSAREIAGWMNWPMERISILENAIDPAFAQGSQGLPKEGIALGLAPGEYFLCVTNPKPHKRFDFLLNSYRQYRRDGGRIPLVTTVDGPAEQGVVRLGGVSSDSLPGWMGNARAVLFPSAYEGFGLPPVEAAVAGTPVIVSDIPAHREALRCFAPGEVKWCRVDDLASWAQAIQEAEQNPPFKPSQASRQKTLETFSPERLARQADTLYMRELARIPQRSS